MASDVLRRAAALMRERAEAATPGPWVHIPSSACGEGTVGGSMTADYDEHVLLIHGSQLPASDAAHIASWDPAVALAVADWLDAVAEHIDRRPLHAQTTLGAHALTVARTYLGGRP